MLIDFDAKRLEVDNHVLETYRTCEEKYRLMIHNQWVPQNRAPELAFGTAFHKARAVYKQSIIDTDTPHINALVDHNSILEQAVASGLASWDAGMPAEMKTEVMIDNKRSKKNLERLIRGYFAKYGGPEFKPLHVETPGFSFLGITPTGWRVNYVYTIDEVVEHNGKIYPLEFKTTSGWTPPDGFFFAQFDNFAAITGYIWAVEQHYGYDISGAILHAAWVHPEPKPGTRSKYGIEDYFRMSYTYRDDAQLAEWKHNTLITCDDIVRSVEENRWRRADGPVCTLFNGCPMKTVCGATPASRQRLLEMDFVKHEWSPWSRLEA